MKWAFVLILLAVGCVQPVTPPKPPEPQPATADALARKSMQDYAKGLSESFARAADAGHDQAAKANESLAADNKAARQRAFAPLDAVLDDRIGGDKWEPAAAAKLFRELADAFGKAAK